MASLACPDQPFRFTHPEVMQAKNQFYLNSIASCSTQVAMEIKDIGSPIPAVKT